MEIEVRENDLNILLELIYLRTKNTEKIRAGDYY